jgi:hypothetical protein
MEEAIIPSIKQSVAALPSASRVPIFMLASAFMVQDFPLSIGGAQGILEAFQAMFVVAASAWFA